MSQFHSKIQSSLFHKYQKDQLKKKELLAKRNQKINIEIIPERKNKELESKLFQIPRNHFLMDYALNDLKTLHSDVQNYMKELNNDLKNPVKSKFIQKEQLEEKIEELEDIEDQILQYSYDNNIELENTNNFIYNKISNKVDAIKTKITNLKNPQSMDKSENEYFLSDDLNREQKLILLKMMNINIQKLNNLELLIGNKKMFTNQSVLSQFQQEYRELDELDSTSITHTGKKLVLICEELRRLEPTPERNYFTKKGEKQRLYRILGKFHDLNKEYEKEYQSNMLVNAFNKLELNQYFLEKSCKIILDKNKLAKIIENIKKESLNNISILSNLKKNLNHNIQALK